MFKFVSENESKRYRTWCSNMLIRTRDSLKENYGIVTQFSLVGSGGRNLITRNGNGSYDLDYNLEIISYPPLYNNNLYLIKDRIRTTLNAVTNAIRVPFSDAHDSTSVLTSIFSFDDHVEFSVDVAIVWRNTNGTLCRLMQNKNAFGIGFDQYTWNEVPSSKNVRKKEKAIKDAKLWNDVREAYLKLKNMYLRREDNTHPSFIVYVEAVNQVYNNKLKQRQ